MVVNVHNVCGSEKLGRKELLNWINEFTGIRNEKIEELSNGVSYCIAVGLLFKECNAVKRVKSDLKFEYEFISNWKLLQSSFVELKIEKQVPVDKLVKAKFQENLEFLQWFKKFVDVNLNETEGSQLNHSTNILSNSPTKTRLQNVSLDHAQKNGNLPCINVPVTVMEQNLMIACRERDYYFKKLQELEEILKEDVHKDLSLTKLLLKVLYAEDRV
uniref:Microtubule-associated protein RP/EB family member 2 (Trinotate prediction) n=1 Tax=Henneguya salminicola TaxID=69463 RepID=A0A6G3MI96_HENSL